MVIKVDTLVACYCFEGEYKRGVLGIVRGIKQRNGYELELVFPNWTRGDMITTSGRQVVVPLLENVKIIDIEERPLEILLAAIQGMGKDELFEMFFVVGAIIKDAQIDVIAKIAI